MANGGPIVERISPPPWAGEASTQAVLVALNGEARFVGGCVRDTLLGRPIGDIDMATPLAPDEVMRRLSAARIKVVPTGLAHGTVTAVAPPRHFEITTLRHDIEAFGRHARVAFTDDWAADALRRDFTMNALFLDADGQVFDTVGGLADLRRGHVRFVGAAEARICEDVLRLLRFYRFYAHYGRGAADAEARAACRLLASLLPTLSAERVAAELLKLLSAPDPLPTLGLMHDDSVLPVLLPEAVRTDRLAALVAAEPSADPLRRLAAIVDVDAEAALELATRLKLSNPQRDRLVALAAPPWQIDLDGDASFQRRSIYHLGQSLYEDVVRLRAAEAGLDPQPVLALTAGRAPPAFPLKGRDVLALGVPAGGAIGRFLDEVAAWWEAGDFRADRARCLAELQARVDRGA